MQIRALITDFDKTLTSEDVLDVLAGAVGKRDEGERLNKLFQDGKLPGLTGLVTRVNFFQGMTRADVEAIVAQDDFLRPGAKELFEYLRANKIVTIIASGGILPLLEIYQKKLGVDYLVCSRPKMNGDTIVSISAEDYSGLDFKGIDCKRILDELGIAKEQVVTIGDSPADEGIFELAALRIGVNPHERVKHLVDYVVHDDLSQIIPILEAYVSGLGVEVRSEAGRIQR